MMNVFTCFVFIFCFHTAITVNISENFIKKNGGFLFSMPKTLVSGKNETVCMSLHKVEVPARILIDLKWKENHFTTLRNLETEHSCFDLVVPYVEIHQPYYVNIIVQVQLNGSIESFHNQDPIILYPNKLVKTFINTDKEIYKPGDKIKIRLFVIDEQFLPQNTKVTEIRIKNPLDVTVAVWENVTLENGLVSLEHQLVLEAITGKWKIESSGEVKAIEVSKYVLPRFRIDLNYLKLIYYKTEHLNIKVCGQYSHGRYVKGFAFVKVTDSHNNMAPVNKLKEMQDGCALFVISSEELAFYKIKEKSPMYDTKIHIYITATVTEKGTNRIDIKSGKALVFLKPYTLKFISNTMFQPGLPYKGKIKLNNVQKNVVNDLIEVCYNIAIKKSWNYLNNEQCSNLTVNDDHTVDFFVLPMKSNIIHINFNARSLNHTEVGDSFLAVRLYSLIGSYISIQQDFLEKPEDECRPPQQFTVYYTTDNLEENQNMTFYFMVKARSRIYKLRKVSHIVKKNTTNHLNELKNIVGEKNKFTKSGTNVDSFPIKFRLDRRIGNKYQILVYYVANNGETIVVTKNVDVEPCLLKVEARWQQQQMVPGATATLNIKSEGHSLCHVSAIDKSTQFISNNPHKFDANAMFKLFSEERESPVSGRKACIPPVKKMNQAAPLSEYRTEDTIWDLRRKRHIYPFSEDFDSYDIFNEFGTIVITNLRVITKPCYNGPLLRHDNPVQFLTEYDDHNEEKSVSTRSFFPETWLWELVPVSNQVQLKRHLPHTITNWITNVLCISDAEGLGLSKETEITSFQSFFIDIITPYSVKRGESFYLYIHVSNYYNFNFPVRISIRLSGGLELKNPKEELTVSFCLMENSTITHILEVTGTQTGTVNATVLAETDQEYPQQCGPETLISKRDVVLKIIQVESEGYPIILTKSALLCASEPNSKKNISWLISAHDEIVPGTEKAYISLNGDLLGKTVENLEDLLDVPTGCGEQIMASMAPSLYALRYLKATNSLKHSTRQRILRNLKIGYQKILNYIHKDGSFSAFGYHDSTGSMFLTAFVVRILQEAKQYIYVDQRIIDKAVGWIFHHQLENGCFNTMLHVFQDMGSTSKENSTASLTAYVIISLMGGNIEVPRTVQTNAKYCIGSQHNADKYTLAISCYALFKVHWYAEANRMLTKLMALSNQQQNMIWWSNKENSSVASDIEITSYVLLSLLHHNTTENLANAHSIVRWLSTKYGPRGAFRSTQDTVVALEALTKYSRLVNSKKLDLEINVVSAEGSKNITLQSKDRLKSKEIALDNSDNDIKIVVTGKGCVLVQLIQSYYLRQIPKSEAFKLAVDIEPVSTIDQCSITSVSPCLAYTGPDSPSNMAVMEVALPSGYEADRASLYRLVDSESGSMVQMFEELENKVNLYFTKLDKKLVCFSFNINEVTLIAARKDSIVKLYDYYRPEYESLQFYNITEKCYHSSVEIPGISTKASSTTELNNITAISVTTDKGSEAQSPEKNSVHIVKRSLDDSKRGVKDNEAHAVEVGINEDFVDTSIDMEFSNCDGNIPTRIKPKQDEERVENDN